MDRARKAAKGERAAPRSKGRSYQATLSPPAPAKAKRAKRQLGSGAAKAPPPRAQKTRARKASPPSAAKPRGGRVGSEERYRLAAAAAAPILLLAPNLVVLEFNREAERLYGLARDDVIGKDYFRTLDRDGRGGLSRADLSEALKERTVSGIEGRVRRPDGTERVLLWNATRVNDPAGRALGVIAVAQDITERQSAEEALREREARLRSIIETAPDAIITIDERGIVQSFSGAAEKLFGYAAGEVIGRNVKMLMPSPHHENHDAYLARYLRTGEKRIIGIGREVEARRKDGSVFPMELAVGEVKLGSTHIFTGFIRDLSARAGLEQELRHAQKMEAIGQLTGGVAHDFNNLITVITGNLEMLEQRLDRAEDREILGEVREAAELGAKLASRLLAFGRRQPLNPRPIDLSAHAAGLSELLRRSLGEMIRIETRLAPDLPLTLADPGQVENVLLNLAINARDAMPEGGRLIIQTESAEIDADYAALELGLRPGPYVLLAVTDTGHGMSPEVLERAFEPFFTTKGAGIGSGLGLSMVYGFVKQSGGHVRLYSEPRRGTTVRIYLPASGEAAARREVPAGHGAGRAPAGEIVLVVEDDDRVRRTSVKRLKELGYEVLEVGSGKAALETIERGEPIDLLFTDVVMPGGMTGIDLAREARALRPQLKILFTSGYADPAVVEDGMPANALWLGKPYSNADLAARLRELLES